MKSFFRPNPVLVGPTLSPLEFKPILSFPFFHSDIFIHPEIGKRYNSADKVGSTGGLPDVGFPLAHKKFNLLMAIHSNVIPTVDL
jgi:hypothetical protein